MPIGHLWTCEEVKKYGRCDDFGTPICPKFPTCERFMALYEKKKNIWIQQEKDQQMGQLQEQRFKMGEMLGKSKLFREAPNQKQRIIIARNIFPQLTEGELREIIEIAKMGITFTELQDRIQNEKPAKDKNVTAHKKLRLEKDK